MFSSRFHWDFHQNRLTQLLGAKLVAGIPILDLTESNPTHAGLVYPSEMMRAFDTPRALDYQPAPAGSLEARQAVAAYYKAGGHDVDLSRILLTASTSEAYAYLFKLLANPGDNVLVPRPSYPLFDYLATMESITVRQYPLAYHSEWSIDLEGLTAALTDRTRAIVVVHPNNPTGSYVKRAELKALVQVCRERELALISDEVFFDYGFAPDPHRAGTLASVTGCLAFAMSGLSKIAGLPQMKLGWIALTGPPDLRAEAFEKLEWISDTYLSVSTPVQCAAEALLRAGGQVRGEIRERCAAHLRQAREALTGSSANILAVEGGWYMTIQAPRVRSEEDWTLELLERENVLVQPGFFYDFESEAHLVVSLLTAPESFREGMARLLRQLDGA